VLVLVIVLGSWMGSEDRRGRQLDRVADRTGDAELEAYNARLRALAARSEG
jgi:putative copper resistance protein D